jgi:glutathione S-transferase
MARPAVAWVFDYKSKQNCGRERQHVTGETHSNFAARAGEVVHKAVTVQNAAVVKAAAS